MSRFHLSTPSPAYLRQYLQFINWIKDVAWAWRGCHGSHLDGKTFAIFSNGLDYLDKAHIFGIDGVWILERELLNRRRRQVVILDIVN